MIKMEVHNPYQKQGDWHVYSVLNMIDSLQHGGTMAGKPCERLIQMSGMGGVCNDSPLHLKPYNELVDADKSTDIHKNNGNVVPGTKLLKIKVENGDEIIHKTEVTNSVSEKMNLATTSVNRKDPEIAAVKQEFDISKKHNDLTNDKKYQFKADGNICYLHHVHSTHTVTSSDRAIRTVDSKFSCTAQREVSNGISEGVQESIDKCDVKLEEGVVSVEPCNKGDSTIKESKYQLTKGGERYEALRGMILSSVHKCKRAKVNPDTDSETKSSKESCEGNAINLSPDDVRTNRNTAFETKVTHGLQTNQKKVVENVTRSLATPMDFNRMPFSDMQNTVNQTPVSQTSVSGTSSNQASVRTPADSNIQNPIGRTNSTTSVYNNTAIIRSNDCNDINVIDTTCNVRTTIGNAKQTFGAHANVRTTLGNANQTLGSQIFGTRSDSNTHCRSETGNDVRTSLGNKDSYITAIIRSNDRNDINVINTNVRTTLGNNNQTFGLHANTVTTRGIANQTSGALANTVTTRGIAHQTSGALANTGTTQGIAVQTSGVHTNTGTTQGSAIQTFGSHENVSTTLRSNNRTLGAHIFGASSNNNTHCRPETQNNVRTYLRNKDSYILNHNHIDQISLQTGFLTSQHGINNSPALQSNLHTVNTASTISQQVNNGSTEKTDRVQMGQLESVSNYQNDSNFLKSQQLEQFKRHSPTFTPLNHVALTTGLTTAYSTIPQTAPNQMYQVQSGHTSRGHKRHLSHLHSGITSASNCQRPPVDVHNENKTTFGLVTDQIRNVSTGRIPFDSAHGNKNTPPGQTNGRPHPSRKNIASQQGENIRPVNQASTGNPLMGDVLSNKKTAQAGKIQTAGQIRQANQPHDMSSAKQINNGVPLCQGTQYTGHVKRSLTAAKTPEQIVDEIMKNSTLKRNNSNVVENQTNLKVPKTTEQIKQREGDLSLSWRNQGLFNATYRQDIRYPSCLISETTTTSPERVFGNSTSESNTKRSYVGHVLNLVTGTGQRQETALHIPGPLPTGPRNKFAVQIPSPSQTGPPHESAFHIHSPIQFGPRQETTLRIPIPLPNGPRKGKVLHTSNSLPTGPSLETASHVNSSLLSEPPEDTASKIPSPLPTGPRKDTTLHIPSQLQTGPFKEPVLHIPGSLHTGPSQVTALCVRSPLATGCLQESASHIPRPVPTGPLQEIASYIPRPVPTGPPLQKTASHIPRPVPTGPPLQETASHIPRPVPTGPPLQETASHIPRPVPTGPPLRETAAHMPKPVPTASHIPRPIATKPRQETMSNECTPLPTVTGLCQETALQTSVSLSTGSRKESAFHTPSPLQTKQHEETALQIPKPLATRPRQQTMSYVQSPLPIGPSQETLHRSHPSSTGQRNDSAFHVPFSLATGPRPEPELHSSISLPTEPLQATGIYLPTSQLQTGPRQETNSDSRTPGRLPKEPTQETALQMHNPLSTGPLKVPCNISNGPNSLYSKEHAVTETTQQNMVDILALQLKNQSMKRVKKEYRDKIEKVSDGMIDEYFNWNADLVCPVCCCVMSTYWAWKKHFDHLNKCTEFFIGESWSVIYRGIHTGSKHNDLFSCPPCREKFKDFPSWCRHMFANGPHGELGSVAFPKGYLDYYKTQRVQEKQQNGSSKNSCENDSNDSEKRQDRRQSPGSVQTVCRKDSNNARNRPNQQTGPESVELSCGNENNNSGERLSQPTCQDSDENACGNQNSNTGNKLKQITVPGPVEHSSGKDRSNSGHHQKQTSSLESDLYLKELNKISSVPFKIGFVCKKCTSFTYSGMYEKSAALHIYERHLSVYDYPCQYCDKVLMSKAALRHHEFNIHLKPRGHVTSSVQESDENVPLESCPVCGKMVAKGKRMTKHIKTAHTDKGKRRRTCETCGKDNLSTKNYRRHIKSHTGKPKEKTMCEVCGVSVANLKTHMKRHLESVEDRKQPCPICGVKVVGLYMHMEFHKERKFTCEICNKKFFGRHHLRTHMKGVHQNLRPFKCSICGFEFTLKHHLNAHVKRIHESLDRESATNVKENVTKATKTKRPAKTKKSTPTKRPTKTKISTSTKRPTKRKVSTQSKRPTKKPKT